MGNLVRQRLHVLKYVPDRFFGFVGDDDLELFFHLRAFKWGEFPTFPPPVIGEPVDVRWDPGSYRGGERAPKARDVYRVRDPKASYGIIEEFNESRGYGFIKTDDGRSHYVHRSEMTDGRLPMRGMEVTFFEGFRQGRSRACYVTLAKGEHR